MTGYLFDASCGKWLKLISETQVEWHSTRDSATVIPYLRVEHVLNRYKLNWMLSRLQFHFD